MHIDHKLPWNPYFVAVNGKSLCNYEGIYVYIGDRVIAASSLASAVALCLQYVKILQKQYPRICNHIYWFLEKVVYGFAIGDIPSSITKLIQECQ